MDFLKKIFSKKESKAGHIRGSDRGVFIGDGGRRGALICGGDDSMREEAIALIGEKLLAVSSVDINGEIRRIFDQLNEAFKGREAGLSGIIYYTLEKHVVIGHVGLARAYIVRDNEILQLTEDDTQGWILFKNGVLTEERLKESPLGTMLTKGIGRSGKLGVNITEYYYSHGDKLLLVDGYEALNKEEEEFYNRFSGTSMEGDESYLQGRYLLKAY